MLYLQCIYQYFYHYFYHNIDFHFFYYFYLIFHLKIQINLLLLLLVNYLCFFLNNLLFFLDLFYLFYLNFLLYLEEYYLLWPKLLLFPKFAVLIKLFNVFLSIVSSFDFFIKNSWISLFFFRFYIFDLAFQIFFYLILEINHIFDLTLNHFDVEFDYLKN